MQEHPCLIALGSACLTLRALSFNFEDPLIHPLRVVFCPPSLARNTSGGGFMGGLGQRLCVCLGYVEQQAASAQRAACCLPFTLIAASCVQNAGAVCCVPTALRSGLCDSNGVKMCRFMDTDGESRDLTHTLTWRSFRIYRSHATRSSTACTVTTSSECSCCCNCCCCCWVT